ncbi:hypothetical protein JZU48_00145 [bacterium]|nr:hypothetical protein [bacterium]
MTTGGKVVGQLQARGKDAMLTPEMVDDGTRRRIMQFLQTMEGAVLEANCEVIGKQLSNLDEKTFLKMAVRVAELRADYVAMGLQVAEHRRPDASAIKLLADARHAYEEMSAVFEAAERLVKRGYVKLN